MDAAAAKLLGAGIATFGMGLAALGVGIIFGMFLSGALRNPAAANAMRPNLLFGFAVTEALGIFSFLVALILLFVV
jgi:F-type H+-transporting ATPase subunit c